FCLRRFFLGLANPRQALRSHFQVIGTLVVIGVKAHEHSVVILIEQRDGPPGSKEVVIGVRGEHQDRLVAHFFQARFFSPGHGGRRYQDSQGGTEASHLGLLRSIEPARSALPYPSVESVSKIVRMGTANLWHGGGCEKRLDQVPVSSQAITSL